MPTPEEAGLRLASLAVFRNILTDPAVAALGDFAAAGNLPLQERVSLYARFAALVLESGGCWSSHLLNTTLGDENRYVRLLGTGKTAPPLLRRTAKAELESLACVARLTAEAAAKCLDTPVPLPRWDTRELDFTAAFQARAARIGEMGYGVFSRHHMFLVGEGGALLPVQNPDPVEERDLTGYGRERALVTANTHALLEGRPAANTLLYGDSGTGKSTCVKAVANALYPRGLRLIELRKDQLSLIPRLIDRLSGNPLKFILFIDDLSFTGNSDNFSALKAVLEGSVSAKTSNMVIYATSNRRHLVRERFSERESDDDVHVRDTLEELGSLSDRFGLTVTFLRPDRDLFLEIVRQYCERFALVFDDDTARRAEAFALSRGGRSARVARQFAEGMAAST